MVSSPFSSTAYGSLRFATLDIDTDSLSLKDSHLANGNAAQIIGKVNPDLSIKALSTRDVGSGVGASPSRVPHSTEK